MARPNKRIRQARRKAREIAKIEALARHANAASIPNVRSNVSAWERAPKFGGVGYTSGHDAASFLQRDLDLIADKRRDYVDPSLKAYALLPRDLQLDVDKQRASQ